MALLGSNPHKTWVFEQCHVALFVEIALLLYFKLLKQTPSKNRFLWFELCHFPLNCAMWHCSQSRINTGFFANSAKFSSQAVGVPEIGFYPPTARTCANLLMSTSDSELPWARIVPCGHAPVLTKASLSYISNTLEARGAL